MKVSLLLRLLSILIIFPPLSPLAPPFFLGHSLFFFIGQGLFPLTQLV